MDKIHDLLTCRVPGEIASHIFTQCLSSNTRPYRKKNICQPLVLGAVCQSWRDIAWTTPQLWTTIVIQIRLQTDPSLKLELLDQWIARSRCLPLDISFDAFQFHQPSRMETLYYPLIDLLNRHSSRWRNLNLFVSRTLFYQFSGDGGTISILNGLTLVTLPPFPDELDSERFSLQTVSPQPQFVKLFNVTLSSVDIKWNNLIQLEGSLDVNELLEIFHYAHQLVGCTITVCSKTTTEYRISETPVFLHFLQHLEIESCLVDPAEIMDMITTPRLRHLEFNCGHDEDLSAHSFISFIIRSNCNLEVFSLNIPIVEDGTMIAILKHLPSSLTQLSLGVDANLSLTKEVCDLFKSPRNPRDAFENRFFPNLESFQCDSPQVLSWPELIETFFGPLSASPASRRLRTLDLKVESNDFLTPIDPNTLRIIQKLQESGVNISIKKWGLDTGYAPHSMIDDDDEVPSTLRKWRKYFHQKMGT